jgi:hypothetical protein
MGNKASPPVPAGLKWCLGCQAALPLERFGRRRSRGKVVSYSRCSSCLQQQRSAHKAAYERWLAHLAEREAAAARRPRPGPLRLPEELDLVPLSLR